MNVAEVYLDGQLLSGIAAFRGLKYSERLDGGCWEASWEMDVAPGWHHPLVRRGADVEIRVGAWPVWAGKLSEPDRESWQMTAQGLSREGEQFAALNPDGTPSTNVTVATGQAITRGMPWVSGVLPSWPAHANPVKSTDGEGVNKVSALWTAAAAASGRFWGVGADRRPYAVERPTVPKWEVAPGIVDLGVADDEFATHLVGAYLDSSLVTRVVVRGDDGSVGTPSWRWGRREVDVNLTARGPMNAAKAGDILDGMLTKVRPRPGYANALELGPYDISVGGSRVFAPFVRAGDVIRLHGVVDSSLIPQPYHDIVVGEVRHEVDSPTVYIEPLGLAARNLAAVLEGDNSSALVT